MSTHYSRYYTIEQAQSLGHALDFYCRMGLGQISEIADILRFGYTQQWNNGQFESASVEACEDVGSLVESLASSLDYPRGASYGIGHRCLDEDANRAYEIKKVIDKSVAEEIKPNPAFRGVNYDGLLLRYTNDEAPTATVMDGSGDRKVVSLKINKNQLKVIHDASTLMLDLFRGDYQAITRLGERAYLIPFNRYGIQREKEPEVRPVMSADQIAQTKALMEAVQKRMGFDKPVDLSGQDVPSYVQSLVAAIQAPTITQHKGSSIEP